MHPLLKHITHSKTQLERPGVGFGLVCLFRVFVWGVLSGCSLFRFGFVDFCLFVFAHKYPLTHTKKGRNVIWRLVEHKMELCISLVHLITFKQTKAGSSQQVILENEKNFCYVYLCKI